MAQREQLGIQIDDGPPIYAPERMLVRESRAAAKAKAFSAKYEVGRQCASRIGVPMSLLELKIQFHRKYDPGCECPWMNFGFLKKSA